VLGRAPQFLPAKIEAEFPEAVDQRSPRRLTPLS
jgi:hypothetical protein